MITEVLGRCVSGCGARQKPAPDEVFGRVSREPEGDIRLPIVQIDRLVGHLHSQIDIRIFSREFDQIRHQKVGGQSIHHGHLNAPRELVVLTDDAPVEAFEFILDLFRDLQHVLADRGHHIAGRETIKEPHSEFPLHGVDAPGHGRMAHAQLRGRRADAASPHERQEKLYVVPNHDCLIFDIQNAKIAYSVPYLGQLTS